jgi:hypothetical protein
MDNIKRTFSESSSDEDSSQ